MGGGKAVEFGRSDLAKLVRFPEVGRWSDFGKLLGSWSEVTKHSNTLHKSTLGNRLSHYIAQLVADCAKHLAGSMLIGSSLQNELSRVIALLPEESQCSSPIDLLVPESL